MPEVIPKPKWREAVDLAASVGMIVVAALVAWTLLVKPRAVPELQPRTPARAIPVEPVSFDGAAIDGKADAQITVIEFSDFQCPYCASFARDVLPELRTKFVHAGMVQFAFLHLPGGIHDRAERAAQAAECAGKQQAFWPMHDRLFEGYKALDEQSLRNYAKGASLSLPSFEGCMRAAQPETLKLGPDRASKIGIAGTPTFLIGRTQPNRLVKVSDVLVGARSLADFQAVFDKLLRSE